MRSVSIDQHAI